MYCIKYMNETRSYKQTWELLQNCVWKFYILGVASKVFQQLWPFSTQQLQQQLNSTSPKRHTQQNFSIFIFTWWTISNSKTRFSSTHRLGNAAVYGDHKPEFLRVFVKWIDSWDDEKLRNCEIHFNCTNKLCSKTNSTLPCIINRWSACWRLWFLYWRQDSKLIRSKEDLINIVRCREIVFLFLQKMWIVQKKS